MPLNALSAEDFLNREHELHYLQGLPELKRNALGGNVFLEGARGIGKTELLKQLYRSLFREAAVVPFYYSFKTGNLRGSYFARDYFSGFVRQYVAFAKKEPSLAEAGAEPLHRLMPAIASLGLHWLVDGIEDFQGYVSQNDVYGQITAAISAPVLAAQKSGTPVMVLLDDFDAAEHLYESGLGDVHGLFSLFGESMGNSLCPHVMTGSAGALDALFTDHALLGRTEPMRLGPLPADLAAGLFRSHLAKLKIAVASVGPIPFLDRLRGNPLYLRNLAKAAWKMGKRELAEKDLIESYSLDVSEGDTAFYWTSILNRYVKSSAKRRALLKLLRNTAESGDRRDGDGSSMVSGFYDAETESVLQASGILRARDTVLDDFLLGLYLREVEGKTGSEVRERIEARYRVVGGESCFEMVIPMSENAELVVAKSVEQIGKNINLDEDFLNHLQLALIEVCINAIEHSGSYEKKVFLKFITRPDRLEIIVENSGKPFSLDSHGEIPVEEKLRLGMKRGWGFKLVQAIMDSVKVERVNDRTRVILIKNIESKEVVE